jgi:DNA-binding NarL/FixJ family response regulator
MIDGLTRADIARELRLSPNTVRTHAQNLLTKLECHSVLEAVALARRYGMEPGGRITG